MPLPISSNIAPARAVAKSRVKRFPISPKPEPESTPAQKAKEETRMEFLQAEKRRRKYRERPPPDPFFLEKALSTQKRPAYPAYDDSPNKRRKVGHGSKSKKLARRAPWEKYTKLKKPLSPPDEPVGTSPREQDPIAAMGRFLDLPTEIRENILRYGLLWPEDINVFCGWSRVYPRSRPRLNLSILYTCRALRDQGLQILFGENTFAYDLRDPLASHGHTDVVLEKVFGNSVVPINEHGHLIRHIRIRIHQSRLHFKEHRESLEKAILKFLPGGGLSRSPNLHTLTLEVPAVCNLYLQTPHSFTRPEEVPVCRYLEKGSKISNALLELRTQWVHVLAWDRFGSCWRTEVDMRYFVKDEQMRLENATYDKDGTQGRDDDTDNQASSEDTDPAACYRTRDVKAMEKRWERQVESAVAGLKNLSWRIQGLALFPDRVVESGLWRPVDILASCGLRNHRELGFVSLPSHYRESSFSTGTRPRRGRTTAARFNPGANPSAKKPAIFQAKSNSKSKTITGINTDDLRVFKAGDAAMETRLLEAQQGVLMSGMEPSERAMLTEQWLENLP